MRINARELREKTDTYYETQRILDLIFHNISKRAELGQYEYVFREKKDGKDILKLLKQFKDVESELENHGFKTKLENYYQYEIILSISWRGC